MKSNNSSSLNKVLVVLDIDGTLVDENYDNNDAILPDFIQRAQASGITFCINSNRSLEDLLPIANLFNIKGLLIGENGAFVYSQSTGIERYLSDEKSLELVVASKQIFEDRLYQELCLLTDSEVYWENIDTVSAITGHEEVSYPENSVVVLNNMHRRFTTSAHIKRVSNGRLISDAALATTAAQRFQDTDIQSSSLFANILVNYVGSTKTNALQAIATEEYDSVYVIGDEAGDFNMSKDIATFMTTQNAHDDIKKLAQRVSHQPYAAGVHELLQFIYGRITKKRTLFSMQLSTQPYKGARDFYPEDKRIQDYMFNVMRRVARRYGYTEYDAPILEPLDLYRAKTGEEIVNEQVYNFVDRGGREVAIRPEMTPTVSRMVAAKRQELGYPVRWFSIPNLWRYERPQRGRLREHWQLNVDIFGEAGIAADHEAISVADAILQEFGATPDTYQVKINSRILVNYLTNDYLGLNKTSSHDLIKLIDRMHKLQPDAVTEAITKIIGSQTTLEKVQQLLAAQTLQDLPDEVRSHESIQDITQLLELLSATGITNAVYDVTLMRGFDYYTDIVFEIHDTHPENNRSMFGGGRYNGLVGMFGVEPVPTVGFGMGDVTLANFLETRGLMPPLLNEVQVVLATVGDTYVGSVALATELRKAGLNVAIDATDRKLDKKIKSAEKQGISRVIFVGDQELKSQAFTVKNIETGEQQEGSVEDIVSVIAGQ